jgi:hypothetical protein
MRSLPVLRSRRHMPVDRDGPRPATANCQVSNYAVAY